MGWLYLVPVFAVVAFALVFVVYGVLQNRQEKAEARRRAEALGQLARQSGLEFADNDAFDLPARLGGLSPFQGDSNHRRLATHVMHGALDGREAFAFDYECAKSKILQRFSAVVIVLDVDLPTLAIRPESGMDRLEEALGKEEIRFESAEFSKAFHVASAQAKFASDFSNPKMMEFLLSRPRFSVDLCGRFLAVTEPPPSYPDQNRWDPDRFREALRIARGIVERIPGFVWEQYREGASS